MPQVLIAVKTFISYVGAQVAVGLNISASIKATMAIGGAVIAGGAFALKKVFDMFEVSMPKVDTDASRQSTVKSTTEPYKIIYGETVVSGPIFWAGTAGTDNKDLYYAIALAGHEVESITDIHFDNIVIPNADINSGNAAGGAVGGTGTFSPKGGSTIATINKHKGESTQTADSLLTGAFSSKWTSAHRARGIAYIVTKWTLNEDSAETWDKFTPSNIMAKVKGRKIYDPRKDSTSSAYDSSLGVSDHRFTDPSTWDWSDNPALCLADYLTAVDFTDAGSFIVGKDYRIESVGTTDFTAIGAASNTVGVRFTATGVGTGTGKASRPSFGMGIVESKIDWDAVATAADGCDVSVDIPDSATEKRFTANGVVFGTDSHRTNIDKILSAMNGNLTYVNGKYVVRAGIYEAHTVDLDEDDLIDGVSVKTSLERGDRFNTVKGLFLDPDSNNKTVEFPKVQLADALSRDNNEELHKEIALNMTNSSYMAQRIANKLIQLSDQQKVIVFPANMSAVRVSVGDRVRVTIGDLSFSNKVFQCIGWTFNEEGGVNLTLREDASTAYADPLPGAYSTVSSTGTITDGFRGVPGPSGLRGVSGEDKVFLDWVNPGNPQDFETIHVFAGTNNDFDHASTVKVGETDGSQFTVESNPGATDGSNFSSGDTRYFWVRAIKFKGTSSEAQSGTHPGTTQGVAITIAATAVDWGNVADPTIGLDLTSDTISIVYDSETTQTGQGISQSGIGQGVSVASGGITMTTGGAIKGGQTAYDTGTGFFLGYDSTAHKFSIGNSGGNKLTFDGADLTVTGAVNATSGDFSGQVAVGSTAGTITVIDGNDTDYRLFTNATLDTDTNQYLPDESSFKVGNDGRVFASNITIYNDDGDVLLSPSGLGAAALNDISTTSGQVVSTVGGTVSNSTSEITLTTSSASESFTITSKVAINDNYDGTQYFSGASTSSTANAEAQLTGVDILIDYYVKADGGSYGASPDVTKTVTIVNSGTPTSTQMRVGGFDRGASYSGSLTRYFALLQDFGGALEIIPNSGGGASSYVVTTASLGSSLFPSAQTYKIKIVMRVVEDGTTTVISGSTTPPSSDNTTTGIYFDGGNSDERHYEITGTGLIKNSDNNFTSGSQNLLSSGGTISGNLTVTGDFTVQGTTTTLDTATLNVEDKNITLNYSTGDSSGSADGAGITIQDAVNSSTDATLNWNATNDRWEFSHQMKTPSLMVGAKERIDVDGDLNNIRNLNISGTITSVGTTEASFAGAISSGQITSTINTGIGIRTTYGNFAQFATDSQMDIVSSGSGTWGSAINLVEGNNTSNTDVWSIARKTTGGDGDSSLHFNFGTNNQHQNTNRVLFSSSGDITASGLVVDKFTNTSGTTGTTFLTFFNRVGTSSTSGDISQQQTFIDFSFTDSNANEYPQVRIGAQVGPDADANDTTLEGKGAFVVYTNNATGASATDPTPTGMAERFRVSYNGDTTIQGDLSANAATFAGDTSVYTGASTGSFNVGRSSAQRFNLYVTDGIGYIRYYQDETDTSNHSVNFEIQSSSSGTNQFYFNKGVNVTGNVTWSGGSSTNANTAYTYSQVGHLPLAGGSMTGDINLTSTASTSPAVTFNTNTGTDASVEFAIRANGESLDFYEPEVSDTLQMRILDDGGVNAVYGLHTGADDGTERINPDGDLVNIGTISSGAHTITGNSDSGDEVPALIISDSDTTAGSKIPAIYFKGGTAGQARIRGGDTEFTIGVGSSYTEAMAIDTSANTSFSGDVIVKPSAVTSSVVGDNATLVVEAAEGQIQVTASDNGDWASNIVMSNVNSTGPAYRHYWLHNVPSTASANAGKFELRTSTTSTSTYIGGQGSGSTALLIVDASGNGTFLGNVTSGGQVQADTFYSGVGSAASPALQVGDNDSGFYDSGGNEIGVTLGGALEFEFTATHLDLKTNDLITDGSVLAGVGSAASPSFKVGDADSGFYDSGSNEIGVTLGGALEYEFTPTQLDLTANNLVTTGTISSGAITSTGQFNIDVASGISAIFNSGTTNVVARFESEDAEAWIDLQDSDSGTYGALIGHDSTNLLKIADQGVNNKFTLSNAGDAAFAGTTQATRLGANAAPNSSYGVNALQNGSMTHAGYFQANGDDFGIEVNATASGSYSSSVLYVRQSSRNTGGNLARFANSDGDKFTLTTAGAATFAGTVTSGDTIYAGNGINSASPVLLELHNFQSDIDGSGASGQGNFINFKMTDGNATFTPQVQIGMLIKDYSGDAGVPSEGMGNFVVKTGQGTDSSGGGTLTERFRVTEYGDSIFTGSINVGDGAVADPMVLIDSASGGDPVLRFDTGAANRQSFIDFFDQGTMAGSIYYNHSDDTLDFAVASNNRTSKLSLDGSGHLMPSGLLKTSATGQHQICNTSGGGAGFLFSDQTIDNTAQRGYFTFYHFNTLSYGSGAAFYLTSTETLSFLVDGKLIYKDGLYLKPSSGTDSAGTKIITEAGALNAYATSFIRAGTVGSAVRGANATLIVESGEGAIQVIADNGGDWASNIIMSNASSSTHRHFWLHNAPSTASTNAGKFELRTSSTTTTSYVGGQGSGSTVLMVVDTSGNATFTSNVTAYSDKRLKTDIETLDGSKVLEMRGVSYTRDGEAGSGVIAQELEEVASELVHTADDEMGTKSVAYGNLTGYLIEAVKMQAKQIDELKQAIEELKNGDDQD